jgi:hypothetical protein
VLTGLSAWLSTAGSQVLTGPAYTITVIGDNVLTRTQAIVRAASGAPALLRCTVGPSNDVGPILNRGPDGKKNTETPTRWTF